MIIPDLKEVARRLAQSAGSNKAKTDAAGMRAHP
jgi:hypothetical protein